MDNNNTMEYRIGLEKQNKRNDQVTELILDNCRASQISGLTDEFVNLETLSLINVGLVTLKGFPRLPKLKKLELSDNRLTGGLNLLHGSPKLQHLNISGNRIKDLEALEPLKEFHDLVNLDLYNCEVTKSDDYRQKVFGLLPNLHSLDGYDRNEREVADSDESESESEGSDVENRITREDNELDDEDDDEVDDDVDDDDDDDDEDSSDYDEEEYNGVERAVAFNEDDDDGGDDDDEDGEDDDDDDDDVDDDDDEDEDEDEDDDDDDDDVHPLHQVDDSDADEQQALETSVGGDQPKATTNTGLNQSNDVHTPPPRLSEMKVMTSTLETENSNQPRGEKRKYEEDDDEDISNDDGVTTASNEAASNGDN